MRTAQPPKHFLANVIILAARVVLIQQQLFFSLGAACSAARTITAQDPDGKRRRSSKLDFFVFVFVLSVDVESVEGVKESMCLCNFIL